MFKYIGVYIYVRNKMYIEQNNNNNDQELRNCMECNILLEKRFLKYVDDIGLVCEDCIENMIEEETSVI